MIIDEYNFRTGEKNSWTSPVVHGGSSTSEEDATEAYERDGFNVYQTGLYEFLDCVRDLIRAETGMRLRDYIHTGVPDLVIYSDNPTGLTDIKFVEIKRKCGKVQKNQIDWIMKYTALPAVVSFIYNTKGNRVIKEVSK